MVVTDCAAGAQRMTAESASSTAPTGRQAVDQLHVVAGLCNAGEFDAATLHLPLAERKLHGDATDKAILRFAESLGPVAELRCCWQSKFELAFNSKNKFM